MKKHLQYIFLFSSLFYFNISKAQLANNCANAINVCNNQLAEQLDDGPGTQECPNGGCGCMLAGEKNTRWFRITVATGGTLEFTISPYNGSADYDFAVWNRGAGGTCPTSFGAPDRCNYAAPQSPTGIRGSGNGNSNPYNGNLFSNSMTVAAGDIIYILVDNWDGTNVGFRLDFFGGAVGSGTGTTATFSCASVNTCSTCSDPDCNTYRFPSPSAYSFSETAANGACHSNFGVNTKTATVCGTFTVPVPFTTVEFPLDRGLEITSSAGNNNACLATAVSHISYQVWGICGTPLTPLPGTGIYTGLDNVTTYKVCKTVDVSSGSADCYLSRICLPYWTMIQNDEQCGAIALTVNASPTAGSNSGATSGFNAGCTAYQDVWYKFTAPASGRIQVNVVPNGTSDVKVSLIGPQAGLTGGVNDCNKPCDQMTNVAGGCNDNAGRAGTESLFSFVIPGQTYYIWISGTAARPNATFTVQVSETITGGAQPTPGPDLTNNGGAPDAIPANDDCTNAIDLNPMCNPRTGTNIGATAICTDPDPQYVSAITLENDVWYKWTAPLNNGNAQVTLEVTSVSCTDGAGVGANGIQFGIFKGSCASLTPVSNGTTSLTFTPTPGATYYFVIDGNAGSQCNFSINIKRPTITTQTCGGGNLCAGSSLNASFNYTYSGSNPGFRWAYCKSSTWGTPCTIDLDNPATYQIYNPATGLPSPGCTPATYTFKGYILADNGATTIPGYPGYPRPQPISANCKRETDSCTFNIYPDIKNTVTVTHDNCSQTIVANASCSPAAPITITGGSPTQTASAGTNGTFTAVTVTWSAPYAASAPAACKTYTIQYPYACPGPIPNNTSCSAATMLNLGTPVNATNAAVSANASQYINLPGACANYLGKGLWYSFVAPQSGKVNISLTNVGSTDGFDAVAYLFDSRPNYYGTIINGTFGDCFPDNVEDYNYYFLFGLESYYYTPNNITLYDDAAVSDQCVTCSGLNTSCKLQEQIIGCADTSTANKGEVIHANYLHPGETYYVMVDGSYNASAANSTGNFTITVTDVGTAPVRPVNDDICGATDLTAVCRPQAGNNIKATSRCDGDPSFPNGYSTENSVWYSYTPSVTGSVTIQYTHATGTHCWFPGAQPGIQFTTYISSDGTCNGTLTNVPAGSVYTGTTSGSVTINMTAGVKYFIMIDGYSGNECSYDFQISNGTSCCTADLGATEGTDKVLCFGDDVTYGVTANPINFGSNAGVNPLIAWQLSNTLPTVINPFDPANSGKSYLIGQVDTTGGTIGTTIYRDVEGNDPNPVNSYSNSSQDFPITMSGFPAGTLFNAATDTISLCVNIYDTYLGDITVSLISPSGVVFPLMNGQCGTQVGLVDVCFSNIGTAGSITTQCPVSTGLGAEITGIYTPVTAWTALNNLSLNGTWKVRITDAAAHASTNNYVELLAAILDIRKPVTTYTPAVGTHHGDLHIVNNDPYKYGSQVFWLTPVTIADSSNGIFKKDSCYSYGTPVKVTMLEKMTTPNFTPTCNAPGDGSNGISLTVTSPDGGWPSLTPKAAPAQHFNYVGSGAASGISFPAPPVDTLETSNAFTVTNGQAWSVLFTDNNGCKSSIGGTFDKPDVGELNVDTTACKNDIIQYSVTTPPPLYSKYKITIDFDNRPQDISWVLYDGTNNVVASGGSYASTLGKKVDSTALIDPNKGPYRIVFYDGYGDGLGNGGGSATGGGNTAANSILVEELNSSGGSTVLYNQPYTFCTPAPCTSPAGSVFSQNNVILGTPTGTYSNGVTTNVYVGTGCGGAAVAGVITSNSNSSGSINTSTLTAGSSYSVKYSFTDMYGCITSLCKPFKVFPRVTINPTINCAANPPTVSVNATCAGCNATYIAEYSYNGITWTTATTANFQDIFTYAHVKNTVTGEVSCEVSSAKLADCPTVLPIELIYIRANSIDNQYIKVTWATASELNTNRFEILRSSDAVNFVKIGELPAAGNSNIVRSYAYDDHDVVPGITYYYQIREVDNGSHTHLTNIANAKLERDKFELISIYPNPVVDNTVITMYSNDVMDITLIVYNDIGELMKNDQKTLKEGLNEWNISTEKWAKGVYYFIIKSDDKPITKQVIKLQ